MIKKLSRFGIATGGTILITLSLMASSALADNNNQNFVATYNQNAQQEASLQQKALALGVNSPSIASINSTVQLINTEISSLYTAEQALANTKPVTATILSPTLTHTDWENKINQLKPSLQNNAKYRNGNHEDDSGNGKQAGIKEWQVKQSRSLNQYWNTHPYNGALTSLQSSILHLQKSAIHYLNEWITLTAQTSNPSAPASISGLTYALGTIAVPALGATSVVDNVAVIPIVKSANGTILSDSGFYTLSGPNGATGVTINSTSGELFVSPGATVGTYTVTYVQDGVAQAVNINVV